MVLSCMSLLLLSISILDNSVYDEGGYLYRISRIIKSLQYCTEKNVIRIWNTNLLNQELIESVLIAQNAESAMNDKLIISLP